MKRTVNKSTMNAVMNTRMMIAGGIITKETIAMIVMIEVAIIIIGPGIGPTTIATTKIEHLRGSAPKFI